MEEPGFSIWILLILMAFLFVVLWGALFVFLGLATWFISRSRLPGEEAPPSMGADWEVPPPADHPPPRER